MFTFINSLKKWIAWNHNVITVTVQGYASPGNSWQLSSHVDCDIQPECKYACAKYKYLSVN